MLTGWKLIMRPLTNEHVGLLNYGSATGANRVEVYFINDLTRRTGAEVAVLATTHQILPRLTWCNKGY